MTDENLDRLLAAVAVSDADVARLDLHTGERDLLEEIMSTPVLDQPDRRTDAPAPRHRRWLVPSVAAAAAVAVVTTASVWAPWAADDQRNGRSGRDEQIVAGQDERPAVEEPAEEPADEPVVSAGNPLVLLDAPGWVVERVDEQASDQGEMTFSDGEHVLEVFWSAAGQHRSYFEDRAYGNKQWPLTVLGLDGTLFRYGNSTDFTTILPADGPTFLEIRGDLGSRDAYVDLVGRLKRVDAEAWSAALPPDAVGPAEASRVIGEMLGDVPLPDGFDASVLETGLTMDRYQLGAVVSGAAACAWMDLWDDATKAGDQAAADEAVEAMRSSRRWAVLRQMNTQGDYPEAVWETAAAMSRDAERGLWVGGLGCDTPPRSLNMD